MSEAMAVREDLIVGGYGRIDGDLPVFTGSTWEDHVQAWIDAEDEVSEGKWKQAAVAASVEVHYGEQSLEEFARQVGCTSRNVRLYRKAYRRKQSRLAENGKRFPYSNLSFSHWTAIPEDWPDDKAESLLDACAENSLSVRGLFRMMKQIAAPDIDAPQGITLGDNPVLDQAWNELRAALDRFRGVAPQFTAAVSHFIEEMEFELRLPSKSNREALFEAISEGYDEIDEIAKLVHKDRENVRVWLLALEDEGKVRRFQKERAPTSRGAKRTGWEIV